MVSPSKERALAEFYRRYERRALRRISDPGPSRPTFCELLFLLLGSRHLPDLVTQFFCAFYDPIYSSVQLRVIYCSTK